MTEVPAASAPQRVSTAADVFRRRWPYAVVGLVASAMFVDASVTSRGFRITLFDDSMISMAYAKTIAEGGGFRWYPGAPAVEGITNPFWALFMAALHVLRLPPAVIMVTVAAVGAATVIVGVDLLRRTLRLWSLLPDAAATATFVAGGLCLPVLYWTVRGMEVGLLLLLGLALVWAAAHGRSGTPRRAVLVVTVVLGAVTRQDFAVTVGAVALWQLWESRRHRAMRLEAAITIGALAVTLASLTLWRYLEFGAWVPNTYHLKLDGFELTDRLVRGLRTSAKLAPVALLGALGLVRLHRTAGEAGRSGLRLLALVAVVNVLYAFWIGGDAWEAVADRFVALPMVVCAMVAVVGLRGFWLDRTVRWIDAVVAVAFLGVSSLLLASEVHWTRLGLRRAVVSLVVVALTAAVVAIVLSRSPGRRRHVVPAVVTLLVFWCTSGVAASLLVGRHLGDDDADRLLLYSYDRDFADLGDELRDVVDPTGTIAVTAAGAPVYFAERPAVDILGKNDPVIAKVPSRLTEFWPGHSKWDLEWTFGELRPDLIAQIWWFSADDMAYLDRLGYRCRLFDVGTSQRRMWVLEGSPHLTPVAQAARPCT